MDIVIKKMETDEEKKGKAYVHWKSWQEAYRGLISQEYLDNLTIETCEEYANKYPDNTIIAKDGDKVIGFVCYGEYRWKEELTDCGEIMAMYILSEYYGTGVAQKLMQAGLEKIAMYPKVAVLVLKDNARAIRFYEKCGFRHDGLVFEDESLGAKEIRMKLGKGIC